MISAFTVVRGLGESHGHSRDARFSETGIIYWIDILLERSLSYPLVFYLCADALRAMPKRGTRGTVHFVAVYEMTQLIDDKTGMYLCMAERRVHLHETSVPQGAGIGT